MARRVPWWGRMRVLLGSVISSLVWLGAAEGTASAKGTFEIFEAAVGTAGTPDADPDSGLALALSYGATLKFSRSPLRFYLLANLHGEHLRASADGPRLERTDLMASFSLRTLLPVGQLLRLYLEGGLGARLGIRDREAWGTETGIEPVLFVGGGAQLRWTRAFSTGLRVAYEPLEPSILPIDGGRATRPRHTALLTVGIHF